MREPVRERNAAIERSAASVSNAIVLSRTWSAINAYMRRTHTCFFSSCSWGTCTHHSTVLMAISFPENYNSKFWHSSRCTSSQREIAFSSNIGKPFYMIFEAQVLQFIAKYIRYNLVWYNVFFWNSTSHLIFHSWQTTQTTRTIK